MQIPAAGQYFLLIADGDLVQSRLTVDMTRTLTIPALSES